MSSVLSVDESYLFKINNAYPGIEKVFLEIIPVTIKKLKRNLAHGKI